MPGQATCRSVLNLGLGAWSLAFGAFCLIPLRPPSGRPSVSFCGERISGRLSSLAQFVVFASGELMFDTGVADHARFAEQWREVNRVKTAIDVHHVKQPATERGDLVEQTAVHAHEFNFRSL